MMTVDELRGEVKRDFEAVNNKIDAVGTSLGQAHEELATIAARFESVSEQHVTEIQALFVARNEHAQRLGEIEKNYTPRRDHERHLERTQAVETQLAMWRGGGLLLHAVITLIGVGGMAAILKFGH